ncbi:MAG: mucoidy inhibitor MuiA family protein [Myroides sp.]
MKNILFPAAIVFSITANAQKPVFTQAQIQSARVYNNAAELKHKASVQIPSGTSEIVITNVANYLNESTVQIGVPKNVTVMSVQFTNAYVEEYDNNQDSPLVKPVKEEIAKKEIELKALQNQLTAERKGIELLDKNQSMSNAQNFSVAELTKLLDFYKTKRTELSNSINKLENQEKTLFEELNTLKGKLTFNETTTEKTSQGKLVVNIMSSSAGTIPLEVSYLTNQATWQPSYEMRIDKINEPIQMLYKAQVQQNTGIDWKNVKLSLTSGPANQNTFAPELQPWFLDYYYPNAYQNDKVMEEVSVASYNNVRKKEIEGRPNASFLQTLQGQIPSLNIQTGTGQPGVGVSTMDDYTQISESQLNITFDIDIPYTILSNGKQHSVALKDTQLPATYSYITTPKLDTNAYLIAKVKNYGDYNILPGEANVIFEGMYVGKTYVNANANDDELRLSLGKDQNISVTRTMINDKSGTKTLSSRKVQDFVYEISVRNNKKESISIIVEDQMPISSNTDIEITLADKGGAATDTEKGKLTWDINLKPNETKKIRFGYQVKSAKDKSLNF